MLGLEEDVKNEHMVGAGRGHGIVLGVLWYMCVCVYACACVSSAQCKRLSLVNKAPNYFTVLFIKIHLEQ